MDDRPVVGIDLGTTFSAIAWVDSDGHPEIIPNREGKNVTPSVVLAREGKFLVGQLAVSQAILYPDNVAICIKRQMGNAEFKFMGEFSPAEISAEILKKVVRDAEAHLGRKLPRAVITHPAYFNDHQISQTKQAGILAGLEVEDLLHEPEAAAIYFGMHKLADGERVLVCDLGGGTYDATVMELSGGVLRAERTRGSAELGGHDWTVVTAELLRTRISAACGEDPAQDPSQEQRLYDLAEAAKCQLSDVPKAVVSWSHRGGSATVELTREELESASSHLMDQVIDKTAEVLNAAGRKPDKIHRTILVGGSSRLPAFVSGIDRLMGQPSQRIRNPDEAVALGAALVAAGFARGEVDRSCGRITIVTHAGGKITRLAMQRRTTHALGTLTASFEYERMIEENADLPAQGEKKFGIAGRQGSVQVPVLQLDNANQEVAELGSFRFEDLPLRDHDYEVTVSFRYDASGLANVSMTDAETGRDLPGRREKFVRPEPSAASETATVVLAVDCSYSMSGSKLEEAKNIFIELASKYAELGRNWSIAVVNFGGDSSISPSTILLHPSTDISAVTATSSRLRCGGSTPMVAALQNIRTILESCAGKRLAIIITDGIPDDETASVQTAQTLQALGIQIATVPVGENADREFLRSIGQFESAIQVDGQGAGMAAAVVDLLKRI